MDLLHLTRRAVETATPLIRDIRPDDMTKPTPCSEWDVRALVNHLVGANYFFAALASDTPLEGSAPADLLGDDAVGAYERSAQAALAAWQSPGALEGTCEIPGGGIFPKSVVLGLNFVDQIVHADDLARAIGRREAIDPELAKVALEFVKQGVGPDFRGETDKPFKAEVIVAEDAPVTDRLAAFLGRQV